MLKRVWIAIAFLLLTATSASAQLVFGPIAARIERMLEAAPGTPFEIAPMVSQGDATPGTWSGVTNNVFDSALAMTGILPCTTDPMTLAGRPGVLELMEQSQVLNEGGQRTTLGYFLRARNWAHAPQYCDPLSDGPCMPARSGPEYFLLMSYDSIPDASFKPIEDAPRLCAFEVFVFGPVVRPDPGQAAFQPWAPLVMGEAVNADGDMLQGVPIKIAKVTNYKPDAEESLIYSGSELVGRGCRVCHGEVKDEPQATLPFPWFGSP